jgi:hypothetical protein
LYMELAVFLRTHTPSPLDRRSYRSTSGSKKSSHSELDEINDKLSKNALTDIILSCT